MLDNRTITFLTVCEEMNFTRAAEKLHISQPAVTQHIQYIESYYHVKLFSFYWEKTFTNRCRQTTSRYFDIHSQ